MTNENIENIVSVIAHIEAHLTEKMDLNCVAKSRTLRNIICTGCLQERSG